MINDELLVWGYPIFRTNANVHDAKVTSFGMEVDSAAETDLL